MTRRDFFERRLEDARRRLAKQIADNKSAWNTYGSELCSADLGRSEQIISKEITHLRLLLALPAMDDTDQDLSGRVTIVENEIAVANSIIKDAEERIQRTVARKRYSEESLECLREIQAVSFVN